MKKAQVWVETVLYTLITIALIGTVLAFITPKINQSKDKIIVEQSINAMQALDESIESVVTRGVGNRVLIREFNIKKGELYIEPDNSKETITLVIDNLASPYTEPGFEVKYGKVKVISGEGTKSSNVTLTLEYSGKVDLNYNDGNNGIKFSPASVPYKFTIENKGIDNNKIKINIKELSSEA